MEGWVLGLFGIGAVVLVGVICWIIYLARQREFKNYERGLKMIPMMIHLPPSTDDRHAKSGEGRDERDLASEVISQAEVMYSIIASTVTKGVKAKVFGQRHLSFEIVANEGVIKFYTVVPTVLTETVKQAILSTYATAKIEEVEPENIFSEESKINGVVGGELTLKKDFIYPINTYEDSKRDAMAAILTAMSGTKQGEGLALQMIIRPADDKWTNKSKEKVEQIRDKKKTSGGVSNKVLDLTMDVLRAPFETPQEHENEEKKEEKPLTNLQQEEINAIENKTKHPGFEVMIRVVASAKVRQRSEAMLGAVVAAFSHFDSASYNGFRYTPARDTEKLATDYIFRFFDQKNRSTILNSVELASLFHLPEQNVIPNSQVERQLTKQVDGPAKVPTEGVILGVNEFRGEQKEIRLLDNDRRRHVYMIGSTGSGKSVLMKNIAYQDMCDGRGFAFLDPHGDAVEDLMGMVPRERIDDVIYFNPADMERPVGMNMFEFTTPDQKDFIVQEGINMLQSLFDPSNQGFFGPRGQHMFRNAALLLMSDPKGASFIDIPQCFTDPEFVKAKLRYVTDKAVYDYWTKEFPESRRSNDAGEVITWFTSKWGPFLANTTMRNILGQTKSGFNLREIMDNKKIFLVNLSKGQLGDINSQLLGMILVMKFQTAAMSRADIPESERKDFCLFVDEFQNFSTESFESILSEARKFRLNLFIVNQFMTQLTDKIREGVLGNVGTLMSGRLGVTDAELMEKAFAPAFNAEDLHKQANYHVISTVMMFDMPSAPFTMRLLPPLAKPNKELGESLKEYASMKYGRTREEVEAEIQERWKVDRPQKKPERPEKPAEDAESTPETLENSD